MQSMISRISARAGSSVVDISVITPSPLNALPAKILTGSATSSIEIEVASGLPMLARIWRADASSVAPSGVASSIAASDSVSFPFSRSSGFLRFPPANFTAAISSLARTRPSWSVSISDSVRASISRPLVGQASATHSFWSSDSMFIRSSPERSLT